MNLLLDSHVWLWAIGDPERLAAKAAAAISSPKNRVLVSSASIWEIAIKEASGKLTLPGAPRTFIPRALEQLMVVELPVTIDHALEAASLPPHHRDPFDRMLIAQAQLENLTLVTADPVFRRYHVKLLAAAV